MVDPHSDDAFVRAARRLGAMSEAQLAECRHLQHAGGDVKPLYQVAFENAYLSSAELFAVLREVDRGRAEERHALRHRRPAWLALVLTAASSVLVGFVVGLVALPAPPPRGANAAASRGAPEALQAGIQILDSLKLKGPLDGQRLDDDLHLAIEELTAACALDPTCAPAFQERARARLLLGDLDRAEQDLTRALELAPGSHRAYFERGIVRLERCFAGSPLYRDPEVADTSDRWRRGAAEDFQKARDRGLGWPQSLIVDAAAAWQSGGPDAAVARCSDPAWESVTAEELHRFRGEALAAKGEFTAAEQALTRAIQIRAQYPEAYLARGLVRLKSGQYHDAAEDLTFCVERRRFLERALYARGQANYSQGRYAAALADWRKCIEIGTPRADRLRELMKDAQAHSQF